MKIKQVTDFLESLAPLSSQESYDNSGLLVGNSDSEITGILVSLDCTEQIVEEAISKGCNLIISHHPIIFGGIHKLTGSNYVERVIEKSIKHSIALYAIHTNLDNYRFGVNYRIGSLIGLSNLRILAPSSNTLNKLIVYVPASNKETLLEAMYSSGAGAIGNYDECSFQVSGTGSFRPNQAADPYMGDKFQRNESEEVKIELLVSSHVLPAVLGAMRAHHPYEEVAYYSIPLENKNQFEGAGMIGEFDEPMPTDVFLKKVKHVFNCGAIRYTKTAKDSIKSVAFCGGSGVFLLKNAIQAKADIFVTADVKYHEFFNAEDHLILVDIGHFESEQYTSQLIADLLKEKFTTFAVHLTEINTNPINYL